MDQTLLSTYRVLAEAHHIIDAAKTLDEALRGVTRSLAAGFRTDFAALWHVDARAKTPTVRPTFWVGNCDITDETHTSGDGSLVGQALSSGHTQVGTDGSAHVAIPIESDVALLGVLELTRSDAGPFAGEQVDVAEMCMMLSTLGHDLDQSPETLWMAGEPVMQVRDVHRIFASGDTTVHVLKGVALDVFRGEFLVLLGESGCGKSTLLNILGGLDEPSSGSVVFEGVEHAGMDDRELTRYRREKTAFVFQSYNLVPVLTARQNLTLISEFCDDPMDPDEALALVGLTERARMRPSQLSGGQQQRVSIARALCKNPEVIFADEPTAALDYETSIEVLEAFERIVERGCTLVMVTHNEEICRMANRVMRLRSGRVAEVLINRDPARARDLKW